MITNPYTQLQQGLVIQYPLLLGTVLWAQEGQSAVQLPGGTVQIVKGTDVAPGSQAWIPEGQLVGEAPALPTIEIEI
jgi:hypothetical protein